MRVDNTFRLKQEDVDIVRLRVYTQRVLTFIEIANARPPVTHLRFPKPHTRSYKGPCNDTLHEMDMMPPPDSLRHSWERGLNLEIDVGYIDPTLAEAIGRAIWDNHKVGDNQKSPVALANVAKIITERCRAQGYRMYTQDVDGEPGALEAIALDKSRTRERRGRMAADMKRASTTMRSFKPVTKKQTATAIDKPANGYEKTESGIYVPRTN